MRLDENGGFFGVDSCGEVESGGFDGLLPEALRVVGGLFF